AVAAGTGGMLAEDNTVCVLSVTELEPRRDPLTAHAVAHARGRPGRGDPPSPLRGAPPHLRAERDRLPSGRSRRGDAPDLERAVRRPDPNAHRGRHDARDPRARRVVRRAGPPRRGPGALGNCGRARARRDALDRAGRPRAPAPPAPGGERAPAAALRRAAPPDERPPRGGALRLGRQARAAVPT